VPWDLYGNILKLMVMAAVVLHSFPSRATGPTFAPEIVDVVPARARAPAGQVLLRIGLSSDEAIADPDVMVGNVTVCSVNACYQAMSPTRIVKLFNTQNGESEQVLQLAIPRQDIQSIHFEIGPARL
jgi:hypothetical protein